MWIRVSSLKILARGRALLLEKFGPPVASRLVHELDNVLDRELVLHLWRERGHGPHLIEDIFFHGRAVRRKSQMRPIGIVQ